MAPFPRAGPVRGFSSKNQSHLQLFEIHYRSLLLFWGLEILVVSANMDFFQGRRMKQLFNYKQVTLPAGAQAPTRERPAQRKSVPHSAY